MFSHLCNGTNIFIQWKVKCTIEASLNGTFHLSSYEYICTIALINIHYLYNYEQKFCLTFMRMKQDITDSLGFLVWAFNSLTTGLQNTKFCYVILVKISKHQAWRRGSTGLCSLKVTSVSPFSSPNLKKVRLSNRVRVRIWVSLELGIEMEVG